jgi:hypothetical protein
LQALVPMAWDELTATLSFGVAIADPVAVLNS